MLDNMTAKLQGTTGSDLEAALTAERDFISKWRKEKDREDDLPLTGLSLSGGGIRSAVFCLGVIQALAKNGILRRFDYLSTVSGGGYIGSSLTWFSSTQNGCGVDADTLPYGIDDPAEAPPEKPASTPLLSYLRRHGSYLDRGDRFGLMRGAAVVARGLILNLLVIWLPLFTLVMVFVRAVHRYLTCEFLRYSLQSPFSQWVLHGSITPYFLSWIFSFSVISVFLLASIYYSVGSGLSAYFSSWSDLNPFLRYSARREFERLGASILLVLSVFLTLESIPFIASHLPTYLTLPFLGSFLTGAGSLLGIWSRLMPRGASTTRIPAWSGPIGAGLILYGLVILSYFLSSYLFHSEAILREVDNRGILKFLFYLFQSNAIFREPFLPVAIFGFSVCIAFFVGLIVDLNETTLHRFYRDSLMAAFMPDLDNRGFPLGESNLAADTGKLCEMCDRKGAPAGPYHLINTHLMISNLRKDTISERRLPIDEGILARWRLRGGVSFVFAPHYSGSDVTGWHRTAENPAFKHITLATAMAISGAAVNPGAADSGVGPQRNKVFGRLMKLLNIRLGYWLPNPRRAAHSRHAPVPNHFSPGLFSNSCGTGGSGRFLELTDGGHFENLGVYELLRREVCTIVACDATADPNLAFSDLQNLISRAEADFGVIFRFQTKPLLGPLMPTQRSGYFPADIPFAKTPFAVADIIYKSGATGTLYYIKPAIFDTLQLDILGFKGTFPAFPHDTTLNQFFDEARFEAYRKLGFACVERMLTVPQIRTTLSII